MIRPFRACGLLLLALLSAATLPSGVAVAQVKLPWADANPLQRLFGKPGETRRRTTRRTRVKPAKAAAAAAAVPSIAAIPVPEARPSAGSAATVFAPSGTDAAALGEPVSETTSKAAVSPPADDAPAAAKALESPARADGDGAELPSDEVPSSENRDKEPSADADESVAPSDAPPTPTDAENKTVVPADPSETAEKPLSEIPVPGRRPGYAAADVQKPAPDDPGTSGVDDAQTPPRADDAPNSTEKLKARVPTIDPAAAVLAAAAVADAEDCEAELTRRGVDFSVDDSIAEGECGVLRPVNVKRLSTGVAVSLKTQMLCRTALALDDWMRDGVVPAARAGFPKDKLEEFRHASTYVCRPRASESGISEHARGSAIDIASFVFGSGKEIGIAAQPEGSPEAAFQAQTRQTACGPFKTVLGPGTDSDHATHFHLDIAARKNGATYCK